MPKFNANLSMLFNEVDFLDRFEAAKDAGFKGVEYLFPYAHRKEDLAELLQANALVQVLHNLPAGDWATGRRVSAASPAYPIAPGNFRRASARRSSTRGRCSAGSSIAWPALHQRISIRCGCAIP
jgi:hydroxypyruvate isomerase